MSMTSRRAACSKGAIVFDAAGNAYVSNVNKETVMWGGGVYKFDPQGNLIDKIYPFSLDWMDLAADQTTMFYTNEGDSIHRFNVQTGLQLSDFPIHDIPLGGNAPDRKSLKVPRHLALLRHYGAIWCVKRSNGLSSFRSRRPKRRPPVGMAGSFASFASSASSAKNER